MIIESFRPFVGKHCETTATGSLLKPTNYEYLPKPKLEIKCKRNCFSNKELELIERNNYLNNQTKLLV